MFRELGTALKIRNCYFRVLQASSLIFLSVFLMLTVVAPLEFVQEQPPINEAKIAIAQ